MEMLSSIRGEKHEFCFVVISLSMFAVAKALTSPMHHCIELSSSDILSGGADICNCKSSANECCMVEVSR